jgi:hypothetical protein
MRGLGAGDADSRIRTALSKLDLSVERLLASTAHPKG